MSNININFIINVQCVRLQCGCCLTHKYCNIYVLHRFYKSI